MDNKIMTERLVLRPLDISDLEQVHKYSSDLENTKYMKYLPNETKDETLMYLTNISREWTKPTPQFYEFAIMLGNELIGAVCIYLDKTNKIGELGWILHKNYWGNEYALEAANAIIEFARTERNITMFIACCDSENIGSYRVMEKLGMVRISDNGIRRNRASSIKTKELMYQLVI